MALDLKSPSDARRWDFGEDQHLAITAYVRGRLTIENARTQESITLELFEAKEVIHVLIDFQISKIS